MKVTRLRLVPRSIRKPDPRVCCVVLVLPVNLDDPIVALFADCRGGTQSKSISSVVMSSWK